MASLLGQGFLAVTTLKEETPRTVDLFALLGGEVTGVGIRGVLGPVLAPLRLGHRELNRVAIEVDIGHHG